MDPMDTVTVRELRNHGGEVLDRVARGETLIVTRSGKPVAELHPVRGRGPKMSVLLERMKKLPPMDPARLRADIDAIIDQSL
jgi:prevent-host-death family protein